MASPAPPFKTRLVACCAVVVGLLLLVIALSCGAPVVPPAARPPGPSLDDSPLPTATLPDPSSPLATPTTSPSATGTPTHTPSPTPSPTATPTGTPSPTATPTDTPTATPSPTASPSPTPSATPTASLTPTASPTVTPSPTPTATPGPTPDGQERTLQVPILMYHYISAAPPNADAIRRDLSVPPERFASHLQALRQAGYQSITLRQLFDTLTRGLPLPPNAIVITFDDGYADAHDNAFPLLREQGFSGAFFVITDLVNEARPEYVSWDDLREMAAAGMEIGCHSRNHPDLSGRSVDYLVWQALGCKESIELELGFHPRLVSYPSGLYDQRTIDVFHSAHYWGGLTSHQGNRQSSGRPFELLRLRVRGSYTAQDLLKLLELRW